MYTKEQIEETCKNMPWLAYQQGLQDGYNSAFHDLRNQAAISAMQGMLSHILDYGKVSKELGLSIEESIAKGAVAYADALIEQMKK